MAVVSIDGASSWIEFYGDGGFQMAPPRFLAWNDNHGIVYYLFTQYLEWRENDCFDEIER